jgi:hypothetical protein
MMKSNKDIWMKYSVRLCESALSLLVVFLMLAATVVMSGRLLGHDFLEGNEQTVAEQQQEHPQANFPTLEDCHFQQVDSVCWKVYTADKKIKGTVINTRLLGADIMGFAAETPVWVFLDKDNVVRELVEQENAETADYFELARSVVFDYWRGRKASDFDKGEIDGYTGATYSVNALDRNIRAALAHHIEAEQVEEKSPSIGWGKTSALILVLLLGLGAAFFFRGNKTLRLVVLVLNIAVVGFWCGQFLSLSLLRGWMQNGLDWIGALPSVLLVVLAFLAPVFGMKKHYCMWVCPLGSMQELAYRLPLPKVQVSARFYRVMAIVRLWVLLLLLAMLWMGIGVDILTYEPFGIFLLDDALPAVLVLASVFIVAGCFVPRPWCRMVCPLGEVLRLAERD